VPTLRSAFKLSAKSELNLTISDFSGSPGALKISHSRPSWMNFDQALMPRFAKGRNLGDRIREDRARAPFISANTYQYAQE